MHTYTPEESVKMGRYTTENTPAKAARHFQVQMANYHEACVIVIMPFLAQGTNLKFADTKKWDFG